MSLFWTWCIGVSSSLSLVMILLLVSASPPCPVVVAGRVIGENEGNPNNLQIEVIVWQVDNICSSNHKQEESKLVVVMEGKQLLAALVRCLMPKVSGYFWFLASIWHISPYCLFSPAVSSSILFYAPHHLLFLLASSLLLLGRSILFAVSTIQFSLTQGQIFIY